MVSAWWKFMILLWDEVVLMFAQGLNHLDPSTMPSRPFA